MLLSRPCTIIALDSREIGGPARPKSEPRLCICHPNLWYVVLLSHILGKLPLIPAGDHVTIPRGMHGRKEASYHLGVDRQGMPGSGSLLLYIITWAMVWSNDYPALAT